MVGNSLRNFLGFWDSLTILSEFFGNSLEILSEFFGDVWFGGYECVCVDYGWQRSEIWLNDMTRKTITRSVELECSRLKSVLNVLTKLPSQFCILTEFKFNSEENRIENTCDSSPKLAILQQYCRSNESVNNVWCRLFRTKHLLLMWVVTLSIYFMVNSYIIVQIHHIKSFKMKYM